MNAIVRILFACCIVTGAVTFGAARQDDLSAIEKRINGLVAAHNYSAALVEAQKLEAIVKARFGADSRAYSGALFDLAYVKQSSK